MSHNQADTTIVTYVHIEVEAGKHIVQLQSTFFAVDDESLPIQDFFQKPEQKKLYIISANNLMFNIIFPFRKCFFSQTCTKKAVHLNFLHLTRFA
jgi:hypothetical protein